MLYNESFKFDNQVWGIVNTRWYKFWMGFEVYLGEKGHLKSESATLTKTYVWLNEEMLEFCSLVGLFWTNNQTNLLDSSP